MEFKCPKCVQDIEAPDEMAGEIVECPSCQSSIVVPESSPVQRPRVKAPQTPPISRTKVKEKTTGGNGSGLVGFGTVVVLFAFVWTFIYMFIYGTDAGDHYNIGLLNNRLVGVVVGCSMGISGLLFMLVGYVKRVAYELSNE